MRENRRDGELRHHATPFDRTPAGEYDATGSVVFRDIPIIKEGTWTDSVSMLPIHYPAEVLRSAVDSYEGRPFNLDHSWHPLDVVGRLENATFHDSGIYADIRLHMETKRSREAATIMEKRIVDAISSENFTQDSWDPDVGAFEATGVKGAGAALVLYPACVDCRFTGAPEGFHEHAEWTTAYINDLPNSAFAAIEPAYKSGDTENKNARHLPHHDASGKLDLPHYRNALARANQIEPVTDSISTRELRARAMSHLEGHRSALESEGKTIEGLLKETEGVSMGEQCEHEKHISELEAKVAEYEEAIEVLKTEVGQITVESEEAAASVEARDAEIEKLSAEIEKLKNEPVVQTLTGDPESDVTSDIGLPVSIKKGTITAMDW